MNSLMLQRNIKGKGTLLHLTRTVRAYLSLIEGPLTTFQIRTLIRENLSRMFVGKALARKLYKDAQLYNSNGTEKKLSIRRFP